MQRGGHPGETVRTQDLSRARCNTHSLIGVQHSLSPRLALVAGTPNNLGPSELVFPCLSAFVANTWSPKHLVEGELLHELSPSVRGYLELLDVLLSITLVM